MTDSYRLLVSCPRGSRPYGIWDLTTRLGYQLSRYCILIAFFAPRPCYLRTVVSVDCHRPMALQLYSDLLSFYLGRIVMKLPALYPDSSLHFR